MNQKGNEPMVFLRIRIPAEMKDDLQIMADDDRRNLSDFIRIILDDFLKSKGG